MKPNVILITVDQMRGDCLGVLGHPVVETPYLDTMAKFGAVFTNAYSAVPSCIAARAAILTGLSQRSHGRVGYEDGVMWNYEHTIAGEFTKAGYHTQCVGKMHVHPARNLCGFHNVVLHDGYLHHTRKSDAPISDRYSDDYLDWLKEKNGTNTDIIDSGLECNSWVARPWMYEENLHPTNWVAEKSIEFLKRRDPSKPFFLMSAFVRPHSPLDPPKAYFDQYINQDISLPEVGDWVDTWSGAIKDTEDINAVDVSTANGKLQPKAMKRALAAYYGCITHIDHQIGRLIQALHDFGVYKNTIILFTSDHGDLIGDHNLFRKSLPYEGSANIPFIIFDPGNYLKLKLGLKLDNVVELRDVMPTLLDIAGIEIPKVVEGMSIAPLLKDRDFEWRKYIHGEHTYRRASNHYITNGKEKYIWFSQTGEEQFFNLKKDPKELTNLSNKEEYQDRIKYWRSILVKELAGREDCYSDGVSLIVGQTPQPTLKCLKT